MKTKPKTERRIFIGKKHKLEDIAELVHGLNKTWWHDLDTGKPIVRNRLELLALAISEVSECLEGERKNLMDDHLPWRRMAEVEMADTFIRLLDFAGGFKLPLWRQRLMDPIPDDKGEALFLLMKFISLCERSDTGSFVSLSISYIEAYCEKHGYDLYEAASEKLEYNSKRKDHTPEARKAANGKKF